MTELLIWVIIWTIPASIITYELIKLVITTYLNHEKPTPIKYVWRHVWPDYKGEWQKGRVTSVYLRQDTNDIRGKVVGQSDGLYLATMWNGSSKEFMFEYEATKWVEEYKPRVYK